MPTRDLAQENPSQCLRSELKLGAYARDVVSRNIRSEHSRDVQNLGFRLGKLLISHWAVAGAEIHRAGEHLSNTATAADRLIVNFNTRVSFVVLAEPLGIHRIRESCARPI